MPKSLYKDIDADLLSGLLDDESIDTEDVVADETEEEEDEYELDTAALAQVDMAVLEDLVERKVREVYGASDDTEIKIKKKKS